MPKIKCKLIAHSLSPHLSQIYTGFFLLAKRGLITLEQECTKVPKIDKSKPQHLQNSSHAHLTVIINDKIKIHYDTHDAIEIDDDYLEKTDIYFKRSFSKDYIQQDSEYAEKVFPLGLNYKLLPNELDWLAIKRAFFLTHSLKDKALALLDALDTHNLVKSNPRIYNLEGSIDTTQAAKVLFLVTAYDPYDNNERNKEKVEERIRINETRAKCINLMRNELGDQFLGGFNHSSFTEKNYKKYLVTDNKITRKGNYLKTLKFYPICIATTGLHDSIGWKIAEYVALSKAIISEKLNYEVTGKFCKEQNYLEFNSPEECVKQAYRLIENPELRYKMMIENALYYQSYLKADTLILNTLLHSISLETHGIKPILSNEIKN